MSKHKLILKAIEVITETDPIPVYLMDNLFCELEEQPEQVLHLIIKNGDSWRNYLEDY